MRKPKLSPAILYVRARVEGVPAIENGRTFYFTQTGALENDWKPPTELPGLTLKGEPCIEHWAGHHMPAHCQHCNKLMQYSVVTHNWSWMTGVFGCHDHPFEVWVDYYPKRCADTGQDTFNAWPQYADREKRIPMASKNQLLRYQVIQNEDELLSREERDRREAPLLFTLTPEGLVPIPFSFKTAARQIWQRWFGGKAATPKFA